MKIILASTYTCKYKLKSDRGECPRGFSPARQSSSNYASERLCDFSQYCSSSLSTPVLKLDFNRQPSASPSAKSDHQCPGLWKTHQWSCYFHHRREEKSISQIWNVSSWIPFLTTCVPNHMFSIQNAFIFSDSSS